MRWFPKLAAVLLLAVHAPGVFAGGEKRAAVAEPAGKAPEKADSGDGKKSESKDDDKKSKIEIPVPKDHPAKGLKIPYFNGDGKLQMMFTIAIASRVDEQNIQMADLKVETFDEEGEPEMTIDLPDSVMNQETSVISTKKHVLIQRSDFELTGETMEFNTKTKQGTLGGGVRMLIYNLVNEMAEPPKPNSAEGEQSEPKSPEPATP